MDLPPTFPDPVRSEPALKTHREKPIMACPCEFPDRVPWTCVLELVRIFRSGNASGEMANILRHIGCITGATGNMMGTDPGFGATVSDWAPGEGLTTDELIIQLEEKEDQRTTQEGYSWGPEDTARLAALLIEFVQRILSWLKD